MRLIIKINQISVLSKELTNKFGKGFSRANIWNIIAFYKEYGSIQTLSERLNWSHYCELLFIFDKDKRHFYEIECSKQCWSVRELRRQIESSLFEILLLSKGDFVTPDIECAAEDAIDVLKDYISKK